MPRAAQSTQQPKLPPKIRAQHRTTPAKKKEKEWKTGSNSYGLEEKNEEEMEEMKVEKKRNKRRRSCPSRESSRDTVSPLHLSSTESSITNVPNWSPAWITGHHCHYRFHSPGSTSSPLHGLMPSAPTSSVKPEHRWLPSPRRPCLHSLPP
ncbi:hypothetical protein M0R45_006571 [Rubus argutus]|uniref:Uncharacterized protein n=1 Tax=Rubus argutus TaxID=59490 RepID=A0AAW1YQU1_RUBAR